MKEDLQPLKMLEFPQETWQFLSGDNVLEHVDCFPLARVGSMTKEWADLPVNTQMENMISFPSDADGSKKFLVEWCDQEYLTDFPSTTCPLRESSWFSTRGETTLYLTS